MKVLKIVHVINDLDAGGAEAMLQRLLEHIDRRRFRNAVISLRAGGTLRSRIEKLGVEVHGLNMRRGVSDWSALGRCSRLLERMTPDCVQSWLYHADLMALAAGKWAGAPVIVWSIRNSGAADCPAMTHLLARLCGLLSRFPTAIVANSEAGKRAHQRLGYDTRRVVVIPNGFDLECFRPDPEARSAIRRELGISPDAPLIGLIGRFHPVKDHRGFLKAAARLARRTPALRFLLAGRGVVWHNTDLAAMIAPDLAGRVRLLGAREDIPRVMAALDIAACSSRSEGFPNVLGEAMSCGVPCVTTDVGDAARIVGSTGAVAPRENPEAFAAGCQRLLDLGPDGRRQLGEQARRRVAEHFDIARTASRYADVYEALASGAKREPAQEAASEAWQRCLSGP